MPEIASTRAELHRIIDSLAEDELHAAEAVLATMRRERVYAALSSKPGVRFPSAWPPRFEHFEPVPFEGEEPPSEELIRTRR